MYHKNILAPIAVLLLLSALVITLTHFWDVPLKGIVNGFVAITLYATLVAVYLLRFVLIFLGVFAVYRMLWQRHDKQLVI